MSLKKFYLPITCMDNASLRAWGKQVSDTLLECGLVKCADTGQINWTTAVYTLQTIAGYEIWRFDDALQATAPIYIKIEYGVGAVNCLRMYVNVGQGTDGAGNLTGLTSRRQDYIATTSSAIPLNTYWMSYFNYNPVMGFLGVQYGINAAVGTAALSFMIARSCDDDGVPNAEGYALYQRGSSIFVSYKAMLAQGGTQNYSMPVNWAYGGVWSSIVNTDVQLYKHYMATPKIRQLPQCLMYLATEIPAFTEFVSEVSGVPHTYVALPSTVLGANTWGIGTIAGTHLLAMLWE